MIFKLHNLKFSNNLFDVFRNQVFEFYNELGARRSAAQTITHRFLSFCKESKFTANQRHIFNQRYKRLAPSGQY